MGRIAVIRSMEKLTAEMLIKIFKEPRNSVCRQYQNKLGQMGIQLEFTADAVAAIAHKAFAAGIGARALATVTSEIMDDILFEAPGMTNVAKITVTARHGAHPRAPNHAWHQPTRPATNHKRRIPINLENGGAGLSGGGEL